MTTVEDKGADDLKIAQLRRHFENVIRSKSIPKTKKLKLLFLEAVCSFPDPVSCMSRLMGDGSGLEILQDAMRCDTSTGFLNGQGSMILHYLSEPTLAGVADGGFLQSILLSIVEPPIFWHALLLSFRQKQLDELAESCFAWLLMQLVLLPEPKSEPFLAVAEDADLRDRLLSSSHQDTRSFAQRLFHILDQRNVGVVTTADTLAEGPGGRHDNDFVNIQDIAILPTADEVLSQEIPFIRPCTYLDDSETLDERASIHLDNQFRLLREDMLYEFRDDLQVARGQKKGRYRGFVIENLTVLGIYTESVSHPDRRVKWALTFRCPNDLPQLRKAGGKYRRKIIDENKNLLRHQSLTCLVLDDQITAFPSIYRDEDLLAKKPPVVVLQFEGCSRASVEKTLTRLPTVKSIKVFQIDTAVFSYEHVLRSLQAKKILPLSDELLRYTTDYALPPPRHIPSSILANIQAHSGHSLKSVLGTKSDIILDNAQHVALLSCLQQRVSVIQGPPGTGKSFIGALAAKILHDFAKKRILVVCYTNHALDQFLEDLLNIGIPGDSLVRVGGKSDPRTDKFSLHKLSRLHGQPSRSRAERQHIASLFSRRDALEKDLSRSFQVYERSRKSVRLVDVLLHLDLNHEDYASAFEVPEAEEGMTVAGRNGRGVRPDRLIFRWSRGQDAGWYSKELNIIEAREIWKMPEEERRKKLEEWQAEMRKGVIESFSESAQEYNDCLDAIERAHSDTDISLLASKRIIGCTTTGAAKYRHVIQSARPDVLLVEEAGEILESHILTALGLTTDQMILIGDHQQLRPKVNNYALTVAKGDGYDLNRSLFERLVLKGFPHALLRAQHRMRPEISALVRELSYPDLEDAPQTKNRPDIFGLTDNVVFISHTKPEDEDTRLEERRDSGARSSKQNSFEADMILKIIRYLGQQGYGTDKLVILTPYLGQLRLLQDVLKKDIDPILSDLDSFDLVRAGLVSPASSKLAKKRIRIATIDNYQGEESDIVLISLTRSNPNHDIGFLSEPERLTVLLSRARNGLIMIGNPETFEKARRGADLWTKLFSALKRDKHVYDGLPVLCERHRDRTALLRTPDDFDRLAPDGGCTEDCGAMLSCGKHACPQKCHQIADHSKYPCDVIVNDKCQKNHVRRWKCREGPPRDCPKCDREKKEAEKKQKDDFERQEARDAQLRKHQQDIAEIDDELKKIQQESRDKAEAESLKAVLQQKKKDLELAKGKSTRSQKQPVDHGHPSVAPPSSSGSEAEPPRSQFPAKTATPDAETLSTNNASSCEVFSPSELKWKQDKEMFGEINPQIDELMELTGLESVKDQVLRIKDRVATAVRQGVSLKDERFHVCALGNPGTGKTTVARIYAKFLASVGAASGVQFIETTGSKMANDGVDKVRKLVEECVTNGGGVIFVDEAYQLTADHNFGGKQVLDYLLAEMENQRGVLTFIFAGYNKEMEKFIEFNPGISSRIGCTLQFDDYTDNQLHSMLAKRIEKKFSSRMKVEAGIFGLYGRICIRRLGRGRGQKGFGNARSLENILSLIGERQSTRLTAERFMGKQPDDFLYTKEDLIGPDPSTVMIESPAWKELQSLIGLGSVKAAVQQLFDLVISNYKRELDERHPNQVSLNRVFLGNPGTGKTTVAKLYGRILSELGLLSKGSETLVKIPADFIGSALGESEKNTKGILDNAVGKVLVIDEAYSLFPGKGTSDSYRTAVVDTIVAEVQSTPGEDRCVLMLGYRPQMEEMFQNVNPGLSRRFAIEDAFEFEDYTDDELRKALEWKLRAQDLIATAAAKDVAIEVLSRLRNRPNFGNIGAVENLLSQAKLRFQQRQRALPASEKDHNAPFVESDFDPDFDRGKNAANNLEQLFADVVGSESLVKRIRGWQNMSARLKVAGTDPREFVPTTFIFSGPPGTGKTTTARKMGQVYYDLGFLQTAEVIECSASDMVGQYVGHTGPKVTQQLEKALGRVLFIDEAYRLSDGAFAKEAMDELVGLLTQEKFKGKLICILAGYTAEMNELLSTNPGLSSRFPEQIHFPNLTPDQCLSVLKAKLAKRQMYADVLDDISSPIRPRLHQILDQLIQFDSWGNARDVETLSKKLISDILTSDDFSTSTEHGEKVPDAKVMERMLEMLREYTQRAANKLLRRGMPPTPSSQFMDAPPPPITRTSIRTTTRTQQDEPPAETEEKQAPAEVETQQRDAGVSDAVWKQLQADKKAAEDVERRAKEELARLEREKEEKARAEAEAKAELERRARERAAQDELMRLRELARLHEVAAAEARAREEAARRAAEERVRQEQQVQTKLRRLGICPAGFQWIKQEGGYRCSAGGHFVTDAQLGM